MEPVGTDDDSEADTEEADTDEAGTEELFEEEPRRNGTTSNCSGGR